MDNRKGGFPQNSEQNAVSASYKHHPLLPVYDIAGNFAGSRGLNLGNNNAPFARISRNQDDRSKRIRAFGSVYAEAKIADKITAKSTFGFDVVGRRYLDINRPQPEYVEGNFINGMSTGFQDQYQWNFTNQISYKETFNDVHKVEALVGVEALEAFGQSFAAGRQRFPFESTPIISFLNAGNQGTSSNNGGAYLDYALWSQFAKFNYGYGDKYLAQIVVRNDASSRFRAATNSGVFPAASFGWRVSEENFMSGLTFIDDLKLRYGWGQTGNQEIGDYNSYTSYQATSYNSSYPIDGSAGAATVGYNAAQYGNPNAQWETTTSSNFGLDATLLDRKLTVEFDLWSRTTEDLLLNVQIPYGAGDGGAPALNVGEMLNKGFDLALGFNDQKGDFGYSINANISQYRNEIIKLDEFNTPIFGAGRRVPSMTRTVVGSPISMFFGLQTDGIFQTQAEADAAPSFGAYNAPGKFRFVDIDGDGEINDDDRTEIGSPHPDFTYGINLNLSYKNLGLTVFGNGSSGNDIFNYVRYFADFNSFQGNRSVRALRDAWQPSNPSAPRSQWIAANPDATSPIMDANDQTSSRVTTYLIEDGSYFRIRNIQLTYQFGDVINDALGIAGGQIYLQGQNLFTFTNYSGLNPEVNEGSDLTLGYDGGYMPVAKTILVGLNLDLF
jgi:TonB-linked SusC/RagA family outer membrane protein